MKKIKLIFKKTKDISEKCNIFLEDIDGNIIYSETSIDYRWIKENIFNTSYCPSDENFQLKDRVSKGLSEMKTKLSPEFQAWVKRKEEEAVKNEIPIKNLKTKLKDHFLKSNSFNESFMKYYNRKHSNGESLSSTDPITLFFDIDYSLE